MKPVKVLVLILLLQKADYNEQRVREAIQMADEQSDLTNYMGWIIRCIERGYTQTETISGDAERAQYIYSVKEDLRDNEDGIAERVWQKTRQKNDFDSFTKAIEDSGISMIFFEAMYEAKEKMEIYIEWKQKGIVP